ncbi:MAG: class I SAM-dependent methyltransferase [Bdellovibrionota bacterium]
MKIEKWFETALKKKYQDLPVRVELWNGRGVSLSKDPRISFRITSPSALRYLIRPNMSSIGQAYVEGKIQLQGSALETVQILDRLSAQSASEKPKRWKPHRRSQRQDRKAVQSHYDISNEFYRLWLDQNMVYSCAYFPTGRESLDQAQRLKLDYICRKLLLKPGERLLDVGCGWGGLITYAAKHYGVRATGITLSRRQYEHVRKLLRTEGLEDRCQVFLCDYRDLQGGGKFEKIASIGMFEHVGIKHLPSYFAEIQKLLTDDGITLNHGICSSSVEPTYVPGGGGQFMDRYVFPFHELPHMSVVGREMSRQGLEIADVESLRPHYSLTLRHWLARLEANRKKVEREAGARRYRIWRAYLAGSAHSFDRGWITVYQFLASKRKTSGEWILPQTRDHLYAKPLRGLKSVPLVHPGMRSSG